jgi:hypothetical protein
MQDNHLDQGMGSLDVLGKPREKEQISFVAYGFFKEKIFAQLSGGASKVLLAIASLTNFRRNTRATNPTIARWAGVNISTVKRALQELEYYHFIERHFPPGSKENKRVRTIVLQRWDTAYHKLLYEKKAKIDFDKLIINPNPFRKKK